MSVSMKKLGVLVLAAAIFCGFSGFANAKGPKEGPHYMEQLTPEQREKAKAIFEEGKSANMELREQMRAKKAELDNLMESPNPDAARIEALSKELGQLRGKDMASKMATPAKLKEAGLPEMKKPGKDDKKPGDMKGKGEKGDREEFVNRRIEKLPAEKQPVAKKLFEESREATAELRKELKAKKIELDKAVEAGEAAAVEDISTAIGVIRGKLMVAKAELRQNLEKNGIPGKLFDRGDKDGKKKGKKDGKRDGKGHKGDKPRGDDNR